MYFTISLVGHEHFESNLTSRTKSGEEMFGNWENFTHFWVYSTLCPLPYSLDSIIPPLIRKTKNGARAHISDIEM
jgi:hypothetical protein